MGPIITLELVLWKGGLVEEARRTGWERRWEWPLTIVAVLFLAAYAWPILEPDLPESVRETLSWFAWATWLVFILDYLVRLRLSVDRGRFVRSSVFDLLIIALPILRPLRMLRLVTLLSVLNRRVASSLRGRVAVYVVGSTILVLFCAALAVLDAERSDPKANITGFGDALWWASTTVTTVGYGDRFPVTNEGRLVAVLLMIGGIALLGVVTASLASWLLDRVREVEQESQLASRRDIEALTQQVNDLRTELQALSTRLTGPGPLRLEPAEDPHRR
jgi:voltage-gated potassium channel